MNSLGVIELSSINYPYWTSRNNSLEPSDLSSISKVSLVQVSCCSNTGSKRHDLNKVLTLVSSFVKFIHRSMIP